MLLNEQRVPVRSTRTRTAAEACSGRRRDEIGSGESAAVWAASCAGVTRLGRREVMAGADRPRADLNRGLHHPARARSGSRADLPQRRHEPDGHVRSQAGAGLGFTVIGRSTPKRARSKGSDQHCRGSMMKSPFAFRQHGRVGPVGQRGVLPHLATRVDDLAFLDGGENLEDQHVHGAGQLPPMNTGFLTARIPWCLGAWVSYGLGVPWCDNLPTFVVLPDGPRASRTTPEGDFSVGLPADDHIRGRLINASSARAGDPLTCSRPGRPGGALVASPSVRACDARRDEPPACRSE